MQVADVVDVNRRTRGGHHRLEVVGDGSAVAEPGGVHVLDVHDLAPSLTATRAPAAAGSRIWFRDTPMP